MQDAILGELIERAAKECGSKTALAKQMGVSAQRLNDWRTGLRSCPPEQVAIMADIAGLIAEEWLVRATLLNSKGKPYYERLHQALGKWLPRTGAALVLCLLTASLSGFHGEAQADPVNFSTMCVLSIAFVFAINKFYSSVVAKQQPGLPRPVFE